VSDAKPRLQFFAAGERPVALRRDLDELGDLFFSAAPARRAPAIHGAPSLDAPPNSPNDSPVANNDSPSDSSPPSDAPVDSSGECGPAGCDEGDFDPMADELPSVEEFLVPPSLEPLLAKVSPPPELKPADSAPAVATPSVEVVALLAGGLPIESRDRLARLAARRLAVVDHDAPPPPVVTFRGRLATVTTMAGFAPTGDPVTVLADRSRDARRLVLIIAEHVGAFLAAGRRLPEHCVALVTPETESLIEAYRELKVATTATTGPVPEVYVLEATALAEAERTYRRLARVAIAHLGSTPTFAGAALDVAGQGEADSNNSHAAQAGAAADRVYQAVGQVIGDAPKAAPQGEAAVTAPPEDWPASPDVPPPHAAVEVRPAVAQSGQRLTVPPVAGVVQSRPVAPPPAASIANATNHARAAEPCPALPAPIFSTWHPESADQLLAAVRDSLTALVPGARGLVDLADLARVDERPDLLAADEAGRPVAILVTDGRSADVLRRAVIARQWLLAYAPLVARAYPAARLNAAAEIRTLVLAPESAAAAIEPLTPPQVALVAWTPVALGPTRGLLYRQVLWPLGAATTMDAPPPGAPTLSLTQPIAGAPVAAAPSAASTLPTGSPVASVVRRSVAESAGPAAVAEASASDPGTSPDDDLSADEINDLAGPFELDELT
jgi:hypothetical protein